MNIRILDSWLREHLRTKASVKQIAETLSLSSVSIEKVEGYGKDWIYDIEVTTNRPDLMSVIGLAREAATVLSQFGIDAKFTPPKFTEPREKIKQPEKIIIKNDPKLVNRICAVVLEVQLRESPQYIKDRLEASGIRSLNNLIDVTNYVMRETGHPAHVFDYDRLATKTLIIRESKKGEKIVTLDEKEHVLPGGDIVADNGRGEIVDLLGVMGTENSVVTNNTHRILFLIDNNEPSHIRRTSMSLSIRTEAAILNEKSIDPELAYSTLLRGIQLYKEVADAKQLSDIIDIYPNKPKIKTLTASQKKISDVIGARISIKTISEILSKLGFEPETSGNNLKVLLPSWRINDVTIEEDLIEEIARVYGYHRLPSILPPLQTFETVTLQNNEFYWEKRIKDALKYWGFTESYTYSMVSQDLLEGPPGDAVTIQNPLNEDMVYMRKTLVPSLLQVVKDNSNRPEVKIFEIANVYFPKKNVLPDEVLTLAGVVKKEGASFYEVKGVVEQLLKDLGITNLEFKTTEKGGLGADVYTGKEFVGEIEVLDDDLIDFEFNFETILKYVSLKKAYKPVPKFPPVIEDVRVIIEEEVSYEKIVSTIKKQSDLVRDVSLLDTYQDKKTFRIVYQDPTKNLTNEEIAPIREKIFAALERELKAKVV